jgi:hypothetical protein
MSHKSSHWKVLKKLSFQFNITTANSEDEDSESVENKS